VLLAGWRARGCQRAAGARLVLDEQDKAVARKAPRLVAQPAVLREHVPAAPPARGQMVLVVLVVVVLLLMMMMPRRRAAHQSSWVTSILRLSFRWLKTRLRSCSEKLPAFPPTRALGRRARWPCQT
jgi:hypothetical protein